MEKISSVKLKRTVFYVSGLICTCFGVAAILKTGWGLDAWNGVFAGLEKITPLSIGTWSIIIQGCFWITASVLNRTADWFCVIPILFKGIFLDLAKMAFYFVSSPNSLLSVSIFYLFGYSLIAAGTGIYIATGYPKMPIDGLMLALADFFSWDIKKARLIIELCGFILLLLVHGPLGIGTIFATFTIGYVVSRSRNLAQKWLFH